ncbi:MAG: amino acid adenylation domain-containing protein [Acidobacteria bacterium]|nr:amino acid adenylation domain-containing protein [Acidobacteriota bacterium]
MSTAATTKIPIFDTKQKEARDFWIDKLSRETGASNLRPDFDRPADYAGERQSFEVVLPDTLVAKLARVSGDSAFLLYTALLAGLKVCLHRYTGGSPVAVGSPARRKNDGTAPVNALVILDDIDAGTAFKPFLMAVRETLSKAYAQQVYPFERVLKDLRLAKTVNKNPLFDVALALENLHGEMPDTKHDLTLKFLKTPEGIRGSAEFNGGVLREETVRRFTNHFINLLQGALEDVDEQARRAPEAEALTFEGAQLTYKELDARANQLARHLRSLGVGPESLVGVMMGRSFEAIVSILAIWKAGGAYVPLDPAYPQERLAFMIEDARVPLILTQERLAGALSSADLRVVCVDTAREEISRHDVEALESGVAPENAAYVIYTSGSTGQPKGVVVTHQGIPNMAAAQARILGVTEQSRVLQFSSLSFDASVAEIVQALANGATLCLGTQESLLPGPRFVELLRGERVTVATLPPSVLANLPAAELPDLVTMMAAGEACSAEVVARWSAGRRFLNLYGPTEATVWTTSAECEAEGGRPPIGRPILNTQVYVLDAGLRPVPVGVAGELYLSGPGLARGYLNLPELTAEKFIPNPFGGGPGARLYRTGDVARYLADGQLEFVGRADGQVKVRGFRIECGEVEAALGKHPSVNEALVLVREDTPGDKRLVAYVVPRREAEPTAAELRGDLKKFLPDYMVPGAFVLLDAMPLSPNGKVDRRALPSPEQASAGQKKHDYAAPRTPTEEILAGMWAAVLGVERVGAGDNFFELGGHSLLGTQLISRLRETFNVEMPLGVLFESPTLADLARHVEAAAGEARGSEAAAILPAPRGGPLPLSFSQQRLWFLSQLEPDNPVYNISAAVRLKGRLDIGALERTLDEIVGRHEVLRTTLATVDGSPVQVVSPPRPSRIHVVDLSGMPEGEREAEARRRATEEARQPFDLSAGPLLRSALLRLGGDEHVLLFTMHHIVSDGWSMGILIREVATLYGAFTTDRPSPLPELPIQYADFAVWQREWLQGDALETQLAYWRRQLGDNPPVLELNTDHPRPFVRTTRGARHSHRLSPELTNELRDLSRREGATLHMTLLAAFQTLLHRYTGQDDISVGTPVANRNRAETEDLLGFFVNTLVLRTDLSGGPDFRELLRRVKDVALGAYAHQDVPFERLVEELRPERDLSHQPLFQVMFVLQNAPGETLHLPELALSSFGSENETAKFDLTLSVDETEGELLASLEYNTDLFEGATVERMMGHFRTLLGGVVAEPGRNINDLPLISDAERDLLLTEWNDTRAAHQQDACAHQLFEAQARRAPESIALTFEGAQLTYKELDARANQLARHLRGLGVGPETLVGVMMGRSVEVVVSILAIWKAGGAYVPLDPAYPQERLAFMIEDAQAPLLLTQQHLLKALPWASAQVVCVDSAWEEIGQLGDEALEGGAAAENAAYVIYTSGSTGRPKGVVVTHQGIPNMAAAQARTFGVTAESRVLQFSSLSFDASIFETMMALANGATLCLAGQESLLPGPRFVELMRGERVTVATLPPSVLANLPATELPDLVTLTVAGEACSAEVVARWAEGRRFFNLYGPTEATVWTTSAECEPGGGRPPIGRPVANTQVYVLDAGLRPAPVGVSGELYVGGVSLARGYLNRPELTAERFVPNPFGGEPGARLYRTGDVARWLAGGQLEFVGRADNQVKVRGFRIECGEVEAALDQHDTVRESVVVAREDTPGDKRLVAYVVPAEGQTPTVAGLREHVGGRLPGYMIPTSVVFLEALPLTPNGKLDRRALPKPEGYLPEMEATYVAPRSEIEHTVAGIWREVLQVEKVGVNDNFFSLGGHSILLARVHTKLREVFAQELTLLDLFKYPTVAALTRFLSQAADEGDSLDESLERASARKELLMRQTRLRQGRARQN